MKKICLLLTIVGIGLYAGAGTLQRIDTLKDVPLRDSVIKQLIVINPRAGFKNLFESVPAAGGSSFRLNPMAVSFVQDYMLGNTAKLQRMKSWGRPYFDVMDHILTKYKLPEELKYLSVIESDLKSTAVSWAGAVGPWQFMPGTGRMMGLRITKNTDERTDFHKSTHAAARYLTHLYALYGDWLLVIAAYNGGPGAVNSAIRRSGSRNFWQLQNYLPAESRTHVKKFIATHYIMEGEGGLTTITKSERALQVADKSQPLDPASESITITGKYHSLAIAQYTGMKINEFNSANPYFDKQLALTGAYTLKLPADKALLFQAYKPQILEQSIRLMLATASGSF